MDQTTATGLSAAERSIALITAFCVANEDTSLDEEAGEAFYEIVNELATKIRLAGTPAERAEARDALAMTMIKMASITSALLTDCARHHEIEKFDLLCGIAQSLYGSFT